jgi:small subunit ribosomal protein S8
MVTDPISDLLVRLQNGFRRRHDSVSIPASRLKREILRILQHEGYIQGVQAELEDGHPVYVGIKDIPRVKNGIGMAILSTSKGLMTDQDSRRAGLGGEVLCSVW